MSSSSLPILHFAHANSYPAGTYGMFFEQLRRRYDVRALAMHAHNPRYPVDDGWRQLTQELIAELEQSYREPVILVGHSLGGILSLMAARKRPDLARCVVLLDSPVVAGWRAQALRLTKLLGYESKRSPAVASVKRRNAWPDMEAAYQHYAAKAMFAAWPQRVLRDYVEHGIEPQDGGGVRLRFTREAETAVYRTIPHHLGNLARQPYPVPIGFVGGVDSVECRMAGLGATRRLVGRHFRQIPGGHLFPMEAPGAAADATCEMIAGLLRERAPQN
ncbi:alpha/beta hydrolase [Herbaspirillum sp. LeCh32-8]|uniref:alpha/beta fold hydrolase n=1 Tax=Herbaspirillum sp. LeCh32-8 TaxID=2821356 RepID=UPI001AE1D557|nr:alpha/beta hydrolase [Herbaspirillum sp. LeCh32-8]MBP0599509.1 alpha/beta hydrolase [Herbaspirillum sp. LeCh32-8]